MKKYLLLVVAAATVSMTGYSLAAQGGRHRGGFGHHDGMMHGGGFHQYHFATGGERFRHNFNRGGTFSGGYSGEGGYGGDHSYRGEYGDIVVVGGNVAPPQMFVYRHQPLPYPYPVYGQCCRCGGW